MTCPTEDRLLRWLEGDLAPAEARAVAAHVAACPACREQSAQARSARVVLGAAGPAAHPACPDRGALAAFADGHLAAHERSSLAVHLTRCPACREDLEDYRALVEAPPRETLVARLVRGALRVWSLGQLAPTAAPAGALRSAGRAPARPRLVRPFGRRTLEVRLAPARGAVDVTLLVRPAPAERFSVQAELHGAAGLMEVRWFPPDGRLSFDALPPGPWRFVVRDVPAQEALDVELHLSYP